MDTAVPLPSLGRADSGGSSSSSSSSSSSLSDDAASRCSSLFSSLAGDGERRDSFASSVFVDDEEQQCKEQQGQSVHQDTSAESTPSPPGTLHTAGPSRISMSRSISSTTTASSNGGDDASSSSSSSSHGSFISTTNMATPTAELYALSLHPISPSSSVPTASAAPPAGDHHQVATYSRHSQEEQEQGPHYSTHGTNNDSIIASTITTSSNSSTSAVKSFIPATSPDMLRFAARVASRGIPFTSPSNNKRTQSLQLPASTGSSPLPSASSLSNSRPSSARGLNGKVLNAEGFPWTARPSSYTPRGTPSSSHYHHNNASTNKSRPSKSTSIFSSSSCNTQYASSFGGTPSTIFASFQEEAIVEHQSESEDEVEALSEFFPSSFNSRKGHSRPTARQSPTTTRSISPSSSSALLPSSSSSSSSLASVQYRDSSTAYTSSSSQSGAIRDSTQKTLLHAPSTDIASASIQQVQGGKVGQLHDNPRLTASKSTTIHPSLSTESRESVQGVIRPGGQHTDSNEILSSDHHHHLHQSSYSDYSPASARLGHSSTPLVDNFRSMRGAPESLRVKPSCEITSSSPSALLSSGTENQDPPAPSVSTASIGSASTSSLFSGSEEIYHPTRSDTDITSACTRSSSLPPHFSNHNSPSSLFRYEAPLSSSAMAAATATMTMLQQQVSSPSRAASSSPPLLSITTSASLRQNASTTSKAVDASMYATSISSPLAIRNVGNVEGLTASRDDVVTRGVTRGVTSNRLATQGRKASLDDYGRDLKHGTSSSLYGVHLNSLNYQAGSGNSAYSSSRPSTSSSSAYLSSMQNNNYNGCALGSASTRSWTRPWVKDSDTSSIKSSSALSSDGSRSSFENSDREPSVMSPAAPLHVPFLSTAPAPAGCRIIVEALQPDGFDIFITLPGFSHENITLALKKSGALHVLADKYDEDSHGHFERMVELGEPAKDCKVTAVFNGDIVEVHVRKLPKEEIVSTTSISNWSYPSSASSTSSSSYKSMGSFSPSIYHGGTDPVAFYSSSPLLAGASYMAK